MMRPAIWQAQWSVAACDAVLQHGQHVVALGETERIEPGDDGKEMRVAKRRK